MARQTNVLRGNRLETVQHENAIQYSTSLSTKIVRGNHIAIVIVSHRDPDLNRKLEFPELSALVDRSWRPIV
jgi:hypothetical protein